jgi:hypothetical protein
MRPLKLPRPRWAEAMTLIWKRNGRQEVFVLGIEEWWIGGNIAPSQSQTIKSESGQRAAKNGICIVYSSIPLDSNNISVDYKIYTIKTFC